MDINSQGIAPCVVAVTGRFDANEAGGFGTYIDGLRVTGIVDLAIDLSAVDFIDSTALASLVALSRWATTGGHIFELLNPSDPVRVILEITGLDGALTIRLSAPIVSS